MHVTLQRHNAELQRRLDEHRLQERTALVHRREKRVRIERALRDDALSMVYQPIMSLDEHAMKGYEALTRFSMTPLRPPNVWFQEAEEVGLGVELELKAVALATRALEAVPDNVFISVNTSPQTATSVGFADALDPRRLDRLVIELTEHAVVDNYDALSEALSPLRARGMRLAVDDTGSGFSSLRHILTLRPDIIKLDLALTRHIHADPVRRALASALTSFAGEIDATLVAEGIESDEELQTLRRLGIGWGQGFYLGRPGPVITP
jgi:EAL domain-containing protein (putative c-di-GMP-specific phosphodiesterase class I)